MACWLTLERAITLSEDDHVPHARVDDWRAERSASTGSSSDTAVRGTYVASGAMVVVRWLRIDDETARRAERGAAGRAAARHPAGRHA